MNDEKNELMIPPPALKDPNSIEILRAWVAHEDLHCSFLPEIWEDPGAWGVMLADVAKHVANAILQNRGQDKRQTLIRIRDLFNAEIDSPTDQQTNKLI